MPHANTKVVVADEPVRGAKRTCVKVLGKRFERVCRNLQESRDQAMRRSLLGSKAPFQITREDQPLCQPCCNYCFPLLSFVVKVLACGMC
jgi:hypothetical protein